jgi:hypothetical protein
MAEITPPKPLLDFVFYFLIVQAPPGPQIYHPEIHFYGSARTTKSFVEQFFEGLQKLRVGEKLVDFLKLFI